MCSLSFMNILPMRELIAPDGTETAWNIALTPNNSITPDIKPIVNPSFNRTVKFSAVPYRKFRISL